MCEPRPAWEQAPEEWAAACGAPPSRATWQTWVAEIRHANFERNLINSTYGGLAAEARLLLRVWEYEAHQKMGAALAALQAEATGARRLAAAQTANLISGVGEMETGDLVWVTTDACYGRVLGQQQGGVIIEGLGQRRWRQLCSPVLLHWYSPADLTQALALGWPVPPLRLARV